MRVSLNDLLSVQKSMEIEGWLALVDVHDNADSCSRFLLVGTGERPSFGLDGGDHFSLDWGSSGDNCCCTPVSCLSTSGSINVDYVISLV